MHPGVEHPEREEVAHHARPDRREGVRAEVVGPEAPQLRQPIVGHGQELVEGVRAALVAARIDEHLVDPPEVVLDVRQAVRDLMVGRRSSQPDPLEGDDVHQVVLHRPARDFGGRLPFGLRERRAELRDRCPDVVELVDELLVGRHVSSWWTGRRWRHRRAW